jgi:predicted nucleic acid-binding protein
MRVFLDANVLFSAAKSDGAVRVLLLLVEQCGHQWCVDANVIEDARRNLGAKAPDRISVLETLLLRMNRAGAQRVDPALEATLPLPAKDRPVLAAAIRQGCDALVTGDRTHFGALYGRTIHGVAIHSPRSLAQALLAPG